MTQQINTDWLGPANRMLDTRIAAAAGTFDHKMIGIDDSEIRSVRYHAGYDRAQVHIAVKGQNGGLLYSEDVPLFSKDAGVAMALLGSEPWDLHHADGGYTVTYRGADFATDSAAMAFCAAFAHFHGGETIFAPSAPSEEFGKPELDWLRYYACRSEAKVDDNPAMFRHLWKFGTVEYPPSERARVKITDYGYEVLDRERLFTRR